MIATALVVGFLVAVALLIAGLVLALDATDQAGSTE